MEFLQSFRERFQREIAIHIAHENWDNVIDHCLLEAARAEVLADCIGLSAETKKNLVQAAVLHDFYKKHEVEGMRSEVAAGGSGWKSYQATGKEAVHILKEASISPDVIEIFSSIGSQPVVLEQINSILKKSVFAEQDVVRLAMHYLDDYTIDTDWVRPAEKDAAGVMITDFHRRMQRNKSRPSYEKMNQEQRAEYKNNPLFAGKEPFQVGLELCKKIGEYFVRRIKERSGVSIEEVRLPEYIDAQLRQSSF
ncbi:MAG: hypothetical protein Q7R62_03720 [bacterium]|nr:hypothetical protein [bacterium]